MMCRRLQGIGSYYRVSWTPTAGTATVTSAATPSQDGSGTGSCEQFFEILAAEFLRVQCHQITDLTTVVPALTVYS